MLRFLIYKTSWGILGLLGLVVISFAFQKGENSEKTVITKEMLIKERLERRIAEYEKNVSEKCQERIMERATEMVDSILIARAKASRDTIAKPPRPARPLRPEFRSPTDSTPIAPLLKNDSLE